MHLGLGLLSLPGDVSISPLLHDFLSCKMLFPVHIHNGILLVFAGISTFSLILVVSYYLYSSSLKVTDVLTSNTGFKMES